MEIADTGRPAEALAGVRRTSVEGLAEWRCRGRLVAPANSTMPVW